MGSKISSKKAARSKGVASSHNRSNAALETVGASYRPRLSSKFDESPEAVRLEEPAISFCLLYSPLLLVRKCRPWRGGNFLHTVLTSMLPAFKASTAGGRPVRPSVQMECGHVRHAKRFLVYSDFHEAGGNKAAFCFTYLSLPHITIGTGSVPSKRRIEDILYSWGNKAKPTWAKIGGGNAGFINLGTSSATPVFHRYSANNWRRALPSYCRQDCR